MGGRGEGGEEEGRRQGGGGKETGKRERGREKEGGRMDGKRKCMREEERERKRRQEEEGECFITIFKPYRQHVFMVDTLNSFITLLYSLMSQMMTIAPVCGKRTNLDNELFKHTTNVQIHTHTHTHTHISPVSLMLNCWMWS